jgi:hypothetical protein
MFRVKLNRGNLSVSLPFVRPLMQQPQTLAPTFFELIYGALVPDYPVTVAELSAGAGNKLNDIFARFNLYGGPNATTLYTDRLAFDFVNLIPTDYPIVYDLMRRVHDAVPSVFPNAEFDRVEATSLIQFEAQPPGDAREYLSHFQPMGSLEAFKEIGEFICEPVARFNLIGTDQTWRCKFGVEKSLPLANGVFVDLNMVLNRQPKTVPFSEKLELTSRIGTAVRAVLDLELSE